MDRIRSLRGMFLGLLDEEELAIFELMVERGLAYRDYSGSAGWLGLATVGIR